MTNILVTGASGQVGMELQALATKHKAYQFFFTDRTILDITNKTVVNDYFERYRIDVCLNCAAYTAVDKAESAPKEAAAANAKAVQTLAAACQKQDAILIHLSTDYVYDQAQNTPFREADPTRPQSVYAKTKLAGDKFAISLNPKTIVVRTSWVYSSFGHNFVKTMLRFGQEREQLRVVFDQIGSPTYARDLAAALLQIVHKVVKKEVDIEKVRGIYHYSNEGVTSWYDFAKAIFELKKIKKCKVSPIRSAEFPTPAQRPSFSVLDKSKIKETFGIEIPYWKDSLSECLKQL